MKKKIECVRRASRNDAFYLPFPRQLIPKSKSLLDPQLAQYLQKIIL